MQWSSSQSFLKTRALESERRPMKMVFAMGVSHLPNDVSQPLLVVYVDVDDTLVRTVGTKRIPMTGAVDHVRSLHADGAQLYCWSSGGGDYAREVAGELGIAECFTAFLPKPHVLLDDQAVGSWRRLITVHPAQCESESVATYREAIDSGRRPGA